MDFDIEQMDQFPIWVTSIPGNVYTIGYHEYNGKKVEWQTSLNNFFRNCSPEGFVTTSKLSDGSVTTEKLADGAVTTQKLSSNSVKTITILDGAVTEEKLANNSVTSSKIGDGEVKTNDIADKAVTLDKLSDEVLNELRYKILPIGSIIMWYKSSSEIPDGWHLCDGSNVSGFGYVPDLRNRVPRGTISDLGKQGGNDQIRLDVDQLPKHRHVYMGSDNAADIGYPKAQVKYDGIDFPERCGYLGCIAGSCYRDGDAYLYYTSNQGNGNPIDIKPAYTNVLFIIKVK